MTRWKVEPLKWRGLPLLPMPFSPVVAVVSVANGSQRGVGVRVPEGSRQ